MYFDALPSPRICISLCTLARRCVRVFVRRYCTITRFHFLCTLRPFAVRIFYIHMKFRFPIIITTKPVSSLLEIVFGIRAAISIILARCTCHGNPGHAQVPRTSMFFQQIFLSPRYCKGVVHFVFLFFVTTTISCKWEKSVKKANVFFF